MLFSKNTKACLWSKTLLFENSIDFGVVEIDLVSHSDELEEVLIAFSLIYKPAIKFKYQTMTRFSAIQLGRILLHIFSIIVIFFVWKSISYWWYLSNLIFMDSLGVHIKSVEDLAINSKSLTETNYDGTFKRISMIQLPYGLSILIFTTLFIAAFIFFNYKNFEYLQDFINTNFPRIIVDAHISQLRSFIWTHPP